VSFLGIYLWCFTFSYIVSFLLYSVHNSHRRDTDGALRLPIIPEDPQSPGTVFHKYVLHHMSPGQLRIHCFPASPGQRNAFLALNKPLAMYSPAQPLGKNTINDYFAEAGMLLNLDKPWDWNSNCCYCPVLFTFENTFLRAVRWLCTRSPKNHKILFIFSVPDFT
jgi:hypothetical protein